MVLSGREFTPEIVERISGFIAENPTVSRRSLSREVCQWMDWRAPNRRLKQMSCRAALVKLHRKGLVHLPPAHARIASPTPGRAGPEALRGLVGVVANFQQLGPVELVLVGSPDSRPARVWKALMERYHPLGSGPLCGAQLRYLISSPRYGWLGGLAFSASAWRLADRDQWIGWSDADRSAHLSQVVQNSRFLIRPDVRVPHLASHVLSRCTRRLARDWLARYGEEPLLVETFVERGRYAGTTYRAANWQHIGSTQGRGRADRRHQRAVAVKDIYVYGLRRDWRERLFATRADREPLAADPSQNWAQREFGRAALGDARLTERLVTIARDFFAHMQANIPQACGSRAKTKAAYRFFDHPETTMQALLAPHIDATIGRIQAHPVVLAVQDTTGLNYSAHPATEGLGLIGSKRNGPMGLWLHSTLTFTPEGVPLGFLDAQCWARDPKQFGKTARRHERPIEEKESVKWLKSLKAVAKAQTRAPRSMLVSVGDREAHIYELFAAARDGGPSGPKVLIRAERNRSTTREQEELWAFMGKQPCLGTLRIQVPRRNGHPVRPADLSVRCAPVRLKPPQRKTRYGPLDLWAVWAVEAAPPPGLKAVEWMLLTTVSTEGFEHAIERIEWYAKRWGIEVFHRTLKSGCRIESRQLGTCDRLEACLAIDMVVAWHVFHLQMLGRTVPEAPCTVYCDEDQWKALCVFTSKNPIAPEKPPTVREYMRMVGSLGGHLGRKCDGEPGTQALWLGTQRLHDITEVYKVFSHLVPQVLHARGGQPP